MANVIGNCESCDANLWDDGYSSHNGALISGSKDGFCFYCLQDQKIENLSQEVEDLSGELEDLKQDNENLKQKIEDLQQENEKNKENKQFKDALTKFTKEPPKSLDYHAQELMIQEDTRIRYVGMAYGCRIYIVKSLETRFEIIRDQKYREKDIFRTCPNAPESCSKRDEKFGKTLSSGSRKGERSLVTKEVLDVLMPWVEWDSKA